MAGRYAGDGETIALTGAGTFLGGQLIRQLDADPRFRRILALDVRPPTVPSDKLEFCPVDLTIAEDGRTLADRLARVEAVVHGAFHARPTQAGEDGDALEDVGTARVLAACARARPRRLVLLSSTLVYGPSPSNPNWLKEDAPLAGLPGSRFVADKVRAEEQVGRFAAANPGTCVTVLRFAPVLGPTVENYFTRFFARPIAPRVLGMDPLVQFVHEHDAVAGLVRALAVDAGGAFNIVGEGVLPYSTVLAMMGRVPLPMPHFVARRVYETLWAMKLTDAPPRFLDFLRYLCVADGGRARRELGYRPRYDVQRTILDFLGVRGEDSDLDVAQAHG